MIDNVIDFESAVSQKTLLIYRLLYLRMKDCIDMLRQEVIKQVIFLQMTAMEESQIMLK